MKRWPLKDIYFWEAAPFFRLLLPLVVGVVLYGVVSVSMPVAIAVSTIAAAVCAATAFFHKHSVLRWLFTASLYVLLLGIGWLSCYHTDIRNNNSYFGNSLNNADAYVVKLTQAPVEKERTYKLNVAVINTLHDGKLDDATGKSFIYLYKDGDSLRLSNGDTLVVPAAWQLITNAGNPYEFDYAAYCARNNIYYQQFAAKDSVLLYGEAASSGKTTVAAVHDYCMATLAKYITDTKVLGLLQAMLIGDEANLDNELRTAYAETGIIHIIAISGSHISFFFVLIAFLLGWIRHRKYHWLKYMLALPFIWFYVLMAGGSPSAVRAAVMFSILAIGFALQKKPNSLNQLFATAFILLLFQPMWLYSIGFQLSFLAVLSLIVFYRPIYKLWQPLNRIARMLWTCIVASLAAEILVAPLVIYYFHLFPAMFIVANVAAFLFMGLVMVAGILIIAFSWWPVIAVGIAVATTWLANVFHELVYVFQQANPTSFRFLNLLNYEMVLLYIIITAIAIAVIKKRKRATFTALIASCALLASFCYNEWQALHQQKLVVYNINRANHIETVEGKYYTVLATDTALTDDKTNYAVKPSHTAWHAWKQKASTEKEIFVIGGKKILLLKQPVYSKETFPVDYVVINYPFNEREAADMKRIFNPEKVIIGNNAGRRKQEQWIATFKAENQPVHAVSKQGAFVLSAL
jgi:ComEC/Rec2-related protein